MNEQLLEFKATSQIFNPVVRGWRIAQIGEIRSQKNGKRELELPVLYFARKFKQLSTIIITS